MTTGDRAVRIVLADDHTIVRDGLRKLLELEPGFTVVGEAANGSEAIERVRQLKPDVLLLDLAMPRLDGIEVLQALGSEVTDVRVILLGAEIDRQETVEALRLGARGVVLKESATQTLYKCIHSVMAGELWVGRDCFDDVLDSLRRNDPADDADLPPARRLTPRELQVIAAIVEGATNRDIAQRFGLSEQTVKNHVSNIFDKLGVSNRLELGLYAVHHRLPDAFRPGLGGRVSRTRPRRVP